MEKTPIRIPIYTIGYGSRSIAELIEVLHQHEIAYLIDVRSAPYSRYKPEFSKAPLANELERHGIGYIYLGNISNLLQAYMDWVKSFLRLVRGGVIPTITDRNASTEECKVYLAISKNSIYTAPYNMEL